MANRAEVTRRYRERNREEIREKGREYARLRREDPVVREAERQASARARAENPEKVRAAYRAWYARSGREYHRQWREENRDLVHSINARSDARRRAAILSGEKINRRDVFERDEGVCHICGDAVEFAAMEVDHVIPLSRGGQHSLANVSTSHRSCNRWKSDRLMEELVACV